MGERGQASTEYVAVIAVVGLLVVAAAGLSATFAPNLVNATIGQFRRALCVVTGAACESVRPPPCVIAARSDQRRYALSVSFVRVGDDRLLVRERLSDGSVRLTLTERDGLGLHAGIGAELNLAVGGRRIGIGTQADATITALLAGGRVYLARDEREADRIQRKLGSGVLPGVVARPLKLLKGLFGSGGGDDDAPRPAQTFAEGGVQLAGSAQAGRGVRGGLDALASAVVGVRRDRSSGERTVYLAARESLSALVSAVVGASADELATGVLGLTLDAEGRPRRLSLQATGSLGGRTTAPSSLVEVLALGTPAGPLVVPSRGNGRRWELDVNVELGDPQVAAAWTAFRRHPASASAIGALAAALRDRAATQVRSYATTTSRREVGGEVAAGPGIGAEASTVRLESRLTSAAGRPAGGAWERRIDCL